MAITYDAAKGGYTDGATTWSPNSNGVYEIGNLDQLKFFRDAVNDGNSFKGQTVKLTTSIDLNNEEWTPIGKNGAPFQGTFDGQENTVSNLYINTPTQNDVGFFGYTSVGEIKNLTIENADVTGYLDVGAVAGTPYTSEYTNITLTGNVKIQGFSYVGGMFGKNVYADLTNLTINAAEGSYVKAESGAYRTYVGGVIGFMGEGNTIVKNVTSNINVSGSTCDVGGITGIAHYGNSFVNVTCTADEVVLVNAVDEGDQLEVGGIAGVWHNEANTTVQFINCTVENTQIKSTLNGVEQDVSANTISGKAYNAETATSGSQLIGQNVVIEEDGKYSAGEFTVSGPNAVSVLEGKLSDSMTVTPNEDGTFDVVAAVASLNGNKYTTLAGAVEDAGSDDEITVLVDNITGETVHADVNLTITGIPVTTSSGPTITTTLTDAAISTELDSTISFNEKLVLLGQKNTITGSVTSEQFAVGLETASEERHSLTISDGATVEVTGGGNSGRIGFTTDVVITGEGTTFTDNTNLTMDESATLEISDGAKVTLGYIATGGVTNIDNATLLLTGALGSAGVSAFGGISNEETGFKTQINVNDGGVVIAQGGLKVGHRAEATISKDAEVNIFEGGRMEVANTLQIGFTTDGYAPMGVVNVNGGVLDASNADVGLNERSSLNIDGGSFSAQSVTNNGAINVTGEAVVDAEFAATKTGAFSITDATLGQGTNIQFGAMNVDELLPAVTLKGTVTVTDGAYLNTGREGNLTMGFGTGDSGTLNITDGAQVSLGGALYFGSEEALADDGMFYLNISGEGSRLQSDGYNGEFYITGDAVVTVSNGGTIANNARVRSGATYIFGSVDDTVAANVSFRSMELVEQANVTIQGGAVADLGILVFGDQDMAYDGSFTLAADGQLKLNSYSASSGKAEIAVSGMDDDTFSGVWKLIDNTGSNTLDYSAMISNWNDISGSVAVVENDLYRVNVDMTTLKVNAAWSTLDIGEQVADGFYYGFNAFDNLDKVYSTIAAGGVSQIELQSNVQLENGNPPISDMWFKFQDDVTIDSDVAGETRTITLSGHELLLTSMDQSRGNGGQQISITLGKDINILTDSAIWFGYCYDNADAYPQYAGNFATDITLNGSITMTSGQAHIFGHGSTMTITETGSLTVAGSDIQTRGSHLIVNGSGKEMAQAQVQLNHENIEGDSPLVITGDDFVDSPAAASWTLNNTFVNINTFLDRVVNS